MFGHFAGLALKELNNNIHERSFNVFIPGLEQVSTKMNEQEITFEESTLLGFFCCFFFFSKKEEVKMLFFLTFVFNYKSS